LHFPYQLAHTVPFRYLCMWCARLLYPRLWQQWERARSAMPRHPHTRRLRHWGRSLCLAAASSPMRRWLHALGSAGIIRQALACAARCLHSPLQWPSRSFPHARCSGPTAAHIRTQALRGGTKVHHTIRSTCPGSMPVQSHHTPQEPTRAVLSPGVLGAEAYGMRGQTQGAPLAPGRVKRRVWAGDTFGA
jgi:hypothetical protein